MLQGAQSEKPHDGAFVGVRVESLRLSIYSFGKFGCQVILAQLTWQSGSSFKSTNMRFSVSKLASCGCGKSGIVSTCTRHQCVHLKLHRLAA